MADSQDPIWSAFMRRYGKVYNPAACEAATKAEAAQWQLSL
jgi:hypothetical protein